jgi:predicted Holliday junction resolvase-like endonuclease
MDQLMAFWIFLIGIIGGLILGIALVYRAAISPLHKKIEKNSGEQPSATSYDKTIEQFEPTMLYNYPFAYENFRFIGNPIDGIQFEDDRIIFVEFKTDQPKLDPIKNKIKELVKNGKIEWFEFKVE